MGQGACFSWRSLWTSEQKLWPDGQAALPQSLTRKCPSWTKPFCGHFVGPIHIFSSLATLKYPDPRMQRSRFKCNLPLPPKGVERGEGKLSGKFCPLPRVCACKCAHTHTGSLALLSKLSNFYQQPAANSIISYCNLFPVCLFLTGTMCFAEFMINSEVLRWGEDKWSLTDDLVRRNCWPS